ncbi:response regulator transcription factor [Sphingomonas sp. C3-2]|uniref:response regulator transcription factor n=1 Tax=Sphingomonas sp. C3-2 TaxID=3062169 RepID=UPI00294B2BAF|nr:response regulator [Sphingomonas sp. C3-2]WOK37741.1 response regulator [Sphingomonas sp. C3-2]
MNARNLFIVDDDDVVRASLQSLMSVRSGLSIRSFRSGDAFLAELPMLDPGCILLDLHMPGASGLDVLKTLARQGEKHVAIILTGQGDVIRAVQAMKAGASDFLEKPCDHLSLLAAVDHAFEQLRQSTAENDRIRAAQDKLASLSSRELDVLKGLIDGRSNKIIAYDLDISPRTVEIYRAKLMEKLGVKSLSEALRIAFAGGLIPNPD